MDRAYTEVEEGELKQHHALEEKHTWGFGTYGAYRVIPKKQGTQAVACRRCCRWRRASEARRMASHSLEGCCSRKHRRGFYEVF
jgi:hypothetical protein